MDSLISYFQSLNPVTFVSQLPGNVAQGIIWGLMALGLFITFRLLNFADLTVDGSFATGGAVTAILIINGVPAWAAALIALAAGILAGLVTGFLHTVLGIPDILSGILTQIALYSVNLNIMGKANLPVSYRNYSLILSASDIPKAICFGLIFVAVTIGLMYWFFGTEMGSTIRSTGSNPNMSKAQGININTAKVLALAISNGLVALSGSLFAQYQGFADVNMGRGAIVIGLAAVIIGMVIGDAIFRKKSNFIIKLLFVVVGGILYYIAMGIVLWLKMPTDDTKLFTAVIVALFLAVPNLKEMSKNSFKRSAKKNKKLAASGAIMGELHMDAGAAAAKTKAQAESDKKEENKLKAAMEKDKAKQQTSLKKSVNDQKNVNKNVKNKKAYNKPKNKGGRH